MESARFLIVVSAVLLIWLTLFAAADAVQGDVVSINGTADAPYGPPVVVQSTQTGFGDSTLGQVDFANGSELDACYALIADGNLYLLIAGNLESNYNKIEIFIDSQAGGQNRLRGDNVNLDGNGLNRMGDSGLGDGLRFDSGFDADYWIGLTGGGSPYLLFVNYGVLATGGGGLGYYCGQTTAVSNGVLSGGQTGAPAIRATIDNSNMGGVSAGSGAGSGSGVTTGVELAIPLSVIGNPATIKVCIFINGSGHAFVSNQILAGLGGIVNLGEPRAVNMALLAGNQFFTVSPPPTGACCHANGTCTGSVPQVNCDAAGDSWHQGATCLNAGCPVVIKINEIRIDQTGADNDEYFEIAGTPGAPLAGLTYVVIGDGSASLGSGVIDTVIPLDGYFIPADGHFLAAEPTFTLAPSQVDLPLLANGLNFENDDNVTHMLVQGFYGGLEQDLDVNNDCSLDVQPWASVVNKIAVIKQTNPPTSTECHYGPPTVGPDGVFSPGHVFRLPDVTGDWMIGPLDPAFGHDTPGTTNMLRTGACCLPVTGCTPNMLQTDCESASGVFHGTGTTCSPNPCVGACCIGTNCTDVSQSTCLSSGGFFRGSGSTCASVGCTNMSALVINEIWADDGDSHYADSFEFIELFGAANTRLAGLSLIIVDGDTGGLTTSQNYRRISYRADFGTSDVLDVNGYYLIGASNIVGADRTITDSTIENDSQTYALVRTQDIEVSSGKLTDASVTAITNSINNAHQFDSVATVDNDAGDHSYFGAPVVRNGVEATDYLQRIPNGIDTNSAANWQIEESFVEASYVYSPRAANQAGSGACCVNANCVPGTTQAECTTLSGIYRGNATTCETIYCGGACCVGSTCSFLSQSQCTTAGGIYHGDGSTCTPTNPCTGACCLPPVPNNCTDSMTPADCATQGGMFRGAGVTCAAAGPCPNLSNLVINEIWADDPGFDDVEFIELFGTPGTRLAGLSLIVVDGDTNGITTDSHYRNVTFRVDFGPGDFLDTGGFYLMGSLPGSEWPFPPGSLQNGSQTYALVRTQDISTCVEDPAHPGSPVAGCSGIINAARLTDGSVTAITAALLNPDHKVDAVATLDTDAGDHSYFGAPVVQNGANAAGYMQRIPNGADNNQASDWETQFVDFETNGDASSPRGINHEGQGACCVASNCTIKTLAECSAAVGTYHGSGSTCVANACTGACCVGSTCTDNTTRSQCETTMSGTYFGDATTCAAGLCDCKTIDAAKAPLLLGQGVRLCNVVVSSTTDLNGGGNSKSFQVQDATGGVTVFGANASIDALLASAGGITPGKQIELVGTTGTFNGLFELQDGSPLLRVVAITGTPGIPTPIPIATADMADGSATAEVLESKLVKLDCVMFVDGGHGRSFAGQTNYDATDGVRLVTVRISTDNLDLVGQPIPFGPISLTGILSQYDVAAQPYPNNIGYELLLRSLADIGPTSCTGTTGACCSPDGSCACAVVRPTMCSTILGVYRGDGIPCDPSPCPVLPGDINASGVVNVSDVNPFVMVLLGTPLDVHHVPRCDLDCNGVANGGDIQPFVAALLGGG